MTPCEFAVQPWTLNKSMTGVIELRRDQNLTSLPKLITRNWSVWFVILEVACGPNPLFKHFSWRDMFISCFCDIVFLMIWLKQIKTKNDQNELMTFRWKHLYISNPSLVKKLFGHNSFDESNYISYFIKLPGRLKFNIWYSVIMEFDSKIYNFHFLNRNMKRVIWLEW